MKRKDYTKELCEYNNEEVNRKIQQQRTEQHNCEFDDEITNYLYVYTI